MDFVALGALPVRERLPRCSLGPAHCLEVRKPQTPFLPDLLSVYHNFVSSQYCCYWVTGNKSAGQVEDGAWRGGSQRRGDGLKEFRAGRQEPKEGIKRNKLAQGGDRECSKSALRPGNATAAGSEEADGAQGGAVEAYPGRQSR